MSVSRSARIRSLPSPRPDGIDPKAHHAGSSGFVNPWPSFRIMTRTTMFQTRFGKHPEKNFVPVPEGENGQRSPDLVKIRPPDWALLDTTRLRATWIGHASFLVQTPVLVASSDGAAAAAPRGIRVLFDPVWSERTSPFDWIGPKRYSPVPCALQDVPDVDLVCISHNHYDHLDYAAVRALRERRQDAVTFFVPLGVKAWFDQHVATTPEQVVECDWWEQREVSIPGLGSAVLTCVPAQHASGRTPFDQGKSLWCGWTLEAGGKKWYFAGDTAYQGFETPSPCPVFAQIGRALGPFDLAALPIGLCSPPVVMGSVHATPEQSLEIHKEVRAKLSLGMHYGTVRGGISAHFEDVRDPPRRWREAAEKAGVWCGGGVEGDEKPIDTSREGVGLCDIGETVAV